MIWLWGDATLVLTSWSASPSAPRPAPVVSSVFDARHPFRLWFAGGVVPGWLPEGSPTGTWTAEGTPSGTWTPESELI